jgi:cytochrome c-type biogenesis protein CcmH
MTAFVILAAAMLVIALAFPLVPLLRKRGHVAAAISGDPRRLKALDDALAAGVIDSEEYKAKRATLASSTPYTTTAPASRATLLATLALALLLPASAILLYRTIGEPDALDPARLAAAAQSASGEHGVDMSQAIAGLVAKLNESPENADGWALLGRAYQATGQFAESRDALKRAYDLSPDNHDLTVEYAQALALSNEGRRIDGQARQLIEGVLKADPDHQRALWLIGISDYQAGNYNAAITAWNRLLPNLPPDTDIAQSVRAQIAEAQKLGGTVEMADVPVAAPATTGLAASTAPATSAATTSEPAAIGDAPSLTVNVILDPKLKDRLDPSATLFVFARAANGPPMPLAIQRVPASGLPLTVTLDESMGMLPTMKLSMFPQVIIGARISKSGNALAQSGDLQVLSEPVDVARKQPLDLVINSVVP